MYASINLGVGNSTTEGNTAATGSSNKTTNTQGSTLNIGHASRSSIYGSNGDDYLYVKSLGNSKLHAGAGNDTIVSGTMWGSSLNAGDGDDTIYTGGGDMASSLSAGSGSNQIYHVEHGIIDDFIKIHLPILKPKPGQTTLAPAPTGTIPTYGSLTNQPLPQQRKNKGALP